MPIKLNYVDCTIILLLLLLLLLLQMKRVAMLSRKRCRGTFQDYNYLYTVYTIWMCCVFAWQDWNWFIPEAHLPSNYNLQCDLSFDLWFARHWHKWHDDHYTVPATEWCCSDDDSDLPVRLAVPSLSFRPTNGKRKTFTTNTVTQRQIALGILQHRQKPAAALE